MVRKPLLVCALAFVLSVFCTSGTAAKESRGLYVGLAVPVGSLDASFDKTVDTTAPDTPNFTSGTEERNTDLDGWMIGLGVQKAIREQFALRLESRYTSYEANRWVTPFDDVGVRVPSALDADAWSLVLSLAWYLK